MHTAIHLLAHAAVRLVEEAAHGFDPTAVVAVMVTVTLVAILLIGSQIKSRRQLWILLVLFGISVLSVVVYVGAVIAFGLDGLA